MPTCDGIMYTVNDYYKKHFGTKVYKIALDGGMTCPNRDGTLGTNGCIFCLNGSGAFAEHKAESLDVQIENAKKRLNGKCTSGKYIAYFQSYTNTYATTEYLCSLFMPLTEREDIVGIAIGTRPDCLPDETVELLSEINKKMYVSVELGLQTIHEESARYIRRGYELSCYEEAVNKLRKAGIEIVTHIIIGLPGESREMMLQSVEYACRYSDGIKLQLLHVLKETDLARDYEAGKFQTLSLEEYAEIIKACAEIIPPTTVVHRITGDGEKKNLIAPLWSADKKRVLNTINRMLN